MADQTEKRQRGSGRPFSKGVSEPMLNPAAKRVRRHRAAAFLFAKYAQRITNCQRKSVEFDHRMRPTAYCSEG